jgi:hypothetical protein
MKGMRMSLQLNKLATIDKYLIEGEFGEIDSDLKKEVVHTSHRGRALRSCHIGERFCSFQFSKRGGELFCTNAGDRVKISGRAALYLEGTITA